MIHKDNPLLVPLLMAAAHCQGGHSGAGDAIATALACDFPITMGELAKVARAHGLQPAELWPWWTRRQMMGEV